jgi:hypothetical protein
LDAPPPDPLAAMPVLPDDPMLMMTETDNKVSYDISVSIDDHSYPGGLRDKLKRIDQFNTRLHDGEKIQGLAVSEWPVDLSPSAKIERSLSAGSGANTSPTFTVEFQMVQESP